MNDRQRHSTVKPTAVRAADTRARRARGADLILMDHVATCPDCGDYAHPGATVCAACGTHLYPGNTTAPARDSLDERSVQGQKEPIVMVKDCTCGSAGICSRCVMAEYDRDPFNRSVTRFLDRLKGTDNHNVVPIRKDVA